MDIVGSSGGRTRSEVLALAPGQELVLTVEAPDDGPEWLVIVSYQRNGVHNKEAIRLALEPWGDQAAQWAFLAPSVLSLLGVGVGAWLVHRLAASREHAAGRLALKRDLLARDHEALIRFLHGWGESDSSNALRAAWTRLKQEAIIPADLSSQFESTIALLSDPVVSSEDRAKACRNLRQAVDAFVLQV